MAPAGTPRSGTGAGNFSSVLRFASAASARKRRRNLLRVEAERLRIGAQETDGVGLAGQIAGAAGSIASR